MAEGIVEEAIRSRLATEMANRPASAANQPGTRSRS